MKKKHKKNKHEYYYMFCWITFRHPYTDTRVQIGDTVILLDHKCSYDDVANYTKAIRETEDLQKDPVILNIMRVRGPQNERV